MRWADAATSGVLRPERTLASDLIFALIGGRIWPKPRTKQPVKASRQGRISCGIEISPDQGSLEALASTAATIPSIPAAHQAPPHLAPFTAPLRQR